MVSSRCPGRPPCTPATWKPEIPQPLRDPRSRKNNGHRADDRSHTHVAARQENTVHGPASPPRKPVNGRLKLRAGLSIVHQSLSRPGQCWDARSSTRSEAVRARRTSLWQVVVLVGRSLNSSVSYPSTIRTRSSASHQTSCRRPRVPPRPLPLVATARASRSGKENVARAWGYLRHSEPDSRGLPSPVPSCSGLLEAVRCSVSASS